MTLMYPLERDGGIYNQDSTAGVNAKDALLNYVRDNDGNAFYAYVDADTDTLLKVYRKNALWTDAKIPGSGNITISGGSSRRIFLCLNRDQSSLYVACSGQTDINIFNTSDMVISASPITTVTNTIQNMRIDKEGILTVISHNGSSNTIVNRFDTNNGNAAVGGDLSTGLGSLLFTNIYFTVENYLVLGGSSSIRSFSLSGTTYSNQGYITASDTDLTVDIYNNVVWLDTTNYINKAKIIGATGGTIYRSDRTDPLYGISTDSNGNYYFSTWTTTNIQKIHKYENDNDAASMAGTFSVLRRNVATKCTDCDMFGYDVSGDGCAGR